jgi:site-specific recombinase XerD
VNINDLVTYYVAFRRTLGQRCNTTEKILRSFCRAVGLQTPVNRVQTEAVAKFLAGTGPITRTWHFKYGALKNFFGFAVSRGHLDKVPLPGERPQCSSTFIPYIYSREDLCRLLEAISSYQRFPSRMESPTLRAILLLLYGAGLRRGEALRLTVADVDLAKSLLTIGDTKFFKARLVPIGADLTKVLSDYARWRAAMHPSPEAGSHFFIGRDGKAIHRWSLQDAFERLREHAGVRRTDGSRYQPRLHDFRHTFAVNRLTAWYRQGADVQRLVHHLSVYLGHARLAHTQVYLTLTPELLQQASTRFERYAHEEDDDA